MPPEIKLIMRHNLELFHSSIFRGIFHSLRQHGFGTSFRNRRISLSSCRDRSGTGRILINRQAEKRGKYRVTIVIRIGQTSQFNIQANQHIFRKLRSNKFLIFLSQRREVGVTKRITSSRNPRGCSGRRGRIRHPGEQVCKKLHLAASLLQSKNSSRRKLSIGMFQLFFCRFPGDLILRISSFRFRLRFRRIHQQRCHRWQILSRKRYNKQSRKKKRYRQVHFHISAGLIARSCHSSKQNFRNTG